MIVDGATRRRKADANALLSAAWHTAALSRVTGRLPRLSALLKDGGEREARKQTPEQIEAVMRSWMAGRKRKK